MERVRSKHLFEHLQLTGQYDQQVQDDHDDSIPMITMMMVVAKKVMIPMLIKTTPGTGGPCRPDVQRRSSPADDGKDGGGHKGDNYDDAVEPTHHHDRWKMTEQQ